MPAQPAGWTVELLVGGVMAPTLEGRQGIQDDGILLRHPLVTYLARQAPTTRRKNQYRAEQLASWLSQGTANALTLRWEDLQYEELVMLRASLVERYSAGTANNFLKVVRGVLKECWRLGHIPGDRYRRIVDVPGVPDDGLPAGRDVQPEELKTMLRRVRQEGTLKAVRDIAILTTLYGTGMRSFELCGLDLGDYDPHDVSFLVHGKGGRDRLTYGPIWIREPLAEWLGLRGGRSGPLFLSLKWGRLHPRPIPTDSLHHMVTTRAKQAGLAHLTTHDLRRTVIGDLCDAGVDLLTIGKNVGHKNPKTTARYDRRSGRTRQEAVNKLVSPF